MNKSILRGYSNRETAYEVKDYPYGYTLRTSIFYWIESKPGHGDRFCTYTINPKNGRPNASKCSTYSTFKYMYLNEKGHVQSGGIDAYDREKFQARFGFIINQIGAEWISEVQKKNIRDNYAAHILGNSPYEMAKYSEEKKPEFKEWIKATLKHVMHGDFAELVNHPEKPEFDNLNGEVKMVMREYKEPEPIKHNITADSVRELLERTLPCFAIDVSEYTIFGSYLKISIAASNKEINGVQGQTAQRVSLSLNVATLELKPQQYGGNGGQSIYRTPDESNPNERHLAMVRVKIPFRAPECNERAVLAAIERFAKKYRQALIDNRATLKYQNLVDYDALLGLHQTV